MRADATPLHLGHLLEYTDGRGNWRGEYSCLYTALTRDGALAELSRARVRAGRAVGELDLVSNDVTIHPALDLRNATTSEPAAREAGVTADPAVTSCAAPAEFEELQSSLAAGRPDDEEGP